MNIRVLAPDLAAKIAAGEVIERPASVVKELLENSLDASAKQISIEIQGGGIDEIRVTDDGLGIPFDEVDLAFQHHATSKISTEDHLAAISTLGFRGEALPSIASVSRVSLITRCHTSEGGSQSIREWGISEGVRPHGSPVGTSITVSDLFGNLPARKKFLRSPATESGKIQDLIYRYALAYPEIKFQFQVAGRTKLSTSGHGDWLEAIGSVMGSETSNQMLYVYGEESESGYKIEGFTGTPSLSKANRNNITLLVNRRWIYSRSLTFAVDEAYHGLLPEKRFPICVFNLSVPLSEVDVNSHPTKREIRFHQESKIFSLLQRSIRESLISNSPVPFVSSPGVAGFANRSLASGYGRENHYSKSSYSNGMPKNLEGSFLAKSVNGYQDTRINGSDLLETAKEILPTLQVVGQIKLTYIIAEGQNGLYLVDQHAAHERILFDQITERSASKTPQMQPLLQSCPIDLTPTQLGVIDSHQDILRSYGFEFDKFGEMTVLLRGIPSIVKPLDPVKSFIDLLDVVAFEGLMRKREDAVSASLACHSAVRAGMLLGQEEMISLLEQLHRTPNPHTCPHGRPTLIHFSNYQLEREFGRR